MAAATALNSVGVSLVPGRVVHAVKQPAGATSTASSQSPRSSRPTNLAQAVTKREVDDLVKRAQGGDTSAFTELFRRHRSTVVAIGYRMLGPSSDLDDVVQEVFLQVHRSLPAFRGQAKFSTWLHRVAVNVVLMQRRRARSRPVFADDDSRLQFEADTALLPDQDVARQRRLVVFRGLIDKLSEKKRTVFVLHELEGMAPAEIAKVVECPILTVRTRLFYARRELAKMMGSEPSLQRFAQQLQRQRQKSPKSRNGNEKHGPSSKLSQPDGSAASRENTKQRSKP